MDQVNTVNIQRTRGYWDMSLEYEAVEWCYFSPEDDLDVSVLSPQFSSIL